MRKFTILIFLFSMVSLFGQKKSTNNDSQIIESLVKRIENDSIVYHKEISELKEDIKVLSEKANNEIIQQSTQTIKNQDSLIKSFGVIFQILTILIAVIAVGLPILTYLLGVKPSRDALKELETNLDNKVAGYLQKSRSEQIKKSLEHLKGENAELKAQAISFLSLTQHEGFDEKEFFEFYKLIKSNTLSDSQIGSVCFLLGSRVNEYANDLFSDSKYLENNNIKSQAYFYIPKAGIENFIEPIKEFLKDSDNKYGEFITLVQFLNMSSKQSAIQFMDNKDIVDVLDNKALTSMKNIETTFKDLKINEEDLKETYLYKKLDKASV